MKFTTELNKESLVHYYYENKELLSSILAISISILLFLFFIFPQIISFPTRKTQVDAETEKLNKIKQSQQILTSVDSSLVDSELQTASKTLPSTKDFENLLNGISTAASLSNTQIDNYQFLEETEKTSAAPGSFPSLSFTIGIAGGPVEAASFINELYKTYPISEVTGISSSLDGNVVKAVFYYKAFPPLNAEDRMEVRNMSNSEKSILDQISSWNDSSVPTSEEIAPEASASGESNSSPF